MKALTGSRLDDGEAVFLSGEGWVDRFARAQLFADDDAALAAEAHAKTQITLLVDPYLIEVAAVDGGVAPISYREGTTPGWPFGYDELEPWYTRAEKLYRVRGALGTDRTEPRRRDARGRPDGRAIPGARRGLANLLPRHVRGAE